MYKILIVTGLLMFCALSATIIICALYVHWQNIPEYFEPDDCPDEDWVQDCYRKEREDES